MLNSNSLKSTTMNYNPNTYAFTLKFVNNNTRLNKIRDPRIDYSLVILPFAGVYLHLKYE
jgi:hypothetical protein